MQQNKISTRIKWKNIRIDKVTSFFLEQKIWKELGIIQVLRYLKVWGVGQAKYNNWIMMWGQGLLKR